MTDPSVFAVEDTTAQVVWGGRNPGAAVFGDLDPASLHRLACRGRRVPAFRTLASPPGAELCRIATVSDLHIGGQGFGRLPRVYDPDEEADPPHDRCLRAALAEAVEWGAQLVVVKGDITEHGVPEQWRQAAELLGGAGVPVEAVVGNHDTRRGASDGVAAMGAAGVRLTCGGASSRDLPGLRVVTADVTFPGRHGGRASTVVEEVAALVAEAPGPALVAVHQQPQRFARTTHWPPGIPGPEARHFLDTLAAANPAVLVTAGHTHRHRARRHGPLVVTEVGSPKDYPGTWAGYVVHEGGIRQVVRRVAAPAAMRWTNTTRRCYLGVWGPWAAWTLSSRCFTHVWPPSGSSAGFLSP